MQTRLREVRIRRGLTQRDVTSGAGIDPSHYSRVENGIVKASPEMARKIVRFFGPGNELTEMHILYPEDYVAEESRTS